MKLTSLQIDKFRHLENLEFDFTYKTGKKKGEPLDKICIIGQSATGKTSLLEMMVNDITYLGLNGGRIIANQSVFPYGDTKFNSSFSLLSKNNRTKLEYLKNINRLELSIGSTLNSIEDISLYYISVDILNKLSFEVFKKNISEVLSEFRINKIEKIISNIVLFNEDIGQKIWHHILLENFEYMEEFLQFASIILNEGQINYIQEKVDNWKKNHVNPLVNFADKFNIILEKINLEVDLVNTKTIIPLKNKITGESVPFEGISTGTKQLLLTALPLYKLDTEGAIILIDEPERSLYPDMQMDLMDFYQKLAPKAQFIVATHSPFVAASFEPEERFILYFDKNGKVAVRQGESPIGDDPNDLLLNDFKVRYFNKHGEEAYRKYIQLKQEMANETNPEKKKELLLRVVKLGDTYNF